MILEGYVTDKNKSPIANAIVEYLSNKKDRNLPKLLEYSKKLNVEEEVSKYLEVLM